MDLQLENKVVLVTGGAKGIGAAIVRAAAAEAAIPVIVDRDAEASKNLHAEVRTSHVVIADLSSSADCQNAIDSTVEKFGRLDALVNNAGINDKVGLEHGTPEQYVDSLGRNLLHYYNMAHFALPYLKKTRGCIVNISSKTAITGQGGTSGYASSKGSNIGSDPRMGGGAAGLRHPRERGYSRRGHDSALPAVARHIPRSRTEASVRPVQDPSGEKNDLSRRDRGNGSIPAFCPRPRTSPASMCSWMAATCTLIEL